MSQHSTLPLCHGTSVRPSGRFLSVRKFYVNMNMISCPTVAILKFRRHRLKWRAYLPPSFVNWVGEFAIRLTRRVRRDPKLNGRCEVMALPNPTSFWRVKDYVSQLKSSNQLEVESGLETVLRNNAARWEAQEVRADLGICLAGDQMGVNWVISTDEAELEGLALQLDAAWSAGTWGWLLNCLEWWLNRPGTRILSRSMPEDGAITNVYLPGCQTYAACPAWFVDQLWQRPILWRIEQTSERLGQCSAPAMPAGLAGDQRAERPLSYIGLQKRLKTHDTDHHQSQQTIQLDL